jgi:hypothetical protein
VPRQARRASGKRRFLARGGEERREGVMHAEWRCLGTSTIIAVDILQQRYSSLQHSPPYIDQRVTSLLRGVFEDPQAKIDITSLEKSTHRLNQLPTVSQ